MTFRWGQVKEILVDVRMANPFERGNVCEDPERFMALVRMGVNATETLCPECLVYTACQERGYLSQLATLQTYQDTTIWGFTKRFWIQNSWQGQKKFFQPFNDTKRLCIVGSTKSDGFFWECRLSTERLEEWCVNW